MLITGEPISVEAILAQMTPSPRRIGDLEDIVYFCCHWRKACLEANSHVMANRRTLLHNLCNEAYIALGQNHRVTPDSAIHAGVGQPQVPLADPMEQRMTDVPPPPPVPQQPSAGSTPSQTSNSFNSYRFLDPTPQVGRIRL